MVELSDLTAQCIRCGFCLESCPTFAISGDETESPRGRIYLIRSMDEGKLTWSRENLAPIDSCVGCRACETACPSGVKYGQILEIARGHQTLFGLRKKGLGMLLASATNPMLLRLQLWLSETLRLNHLPKVLARSLSSDAQVFETPQLSLDKQWSPLSEQELSPMTEEVALLQGCAMGVLYPQVHEATERLLRRIGVKAVRVSGCCGALHAHNGEINKAHSMADSLSRRVPILTNSAGCGSWLKEAKSSLVFDATEYLFDHGLADILRQSSGFGSLRVAYQDACHLAHGQRIRDQPRELLKSVPGLALIELEEPDMCCGSGGIYNVLQPARAKSMLDRKWRDIESADVSIVVTANPGCHTWLKQAARNSGSPIVVLHILELLEASFDGRVSDN